MTYLAQFPRRYPDLVCSPLLPLSECLIADRLAFRLAQQRARRVPSLVERHSTATDLAGRRPDR